MADRRYGLSSDELEDAVKEMTFHELSEFVKQFEDTFGVTAAAPVAVAAAPAAGGAAAAGGDAAVQDEFDVILESAGEKKINVIKEVRALTSLGLKEAKELVESAPTPVLSGVSQDTAAEVLDALAAAGAVARIDLTGTAVAEESHLIQAVRLRLEPVLSPVDLARVLSSHEGTLIEWLTRQDGHNSGMGARLTSLLEVIDVFSAMWNTDLFAPWLFAPNAHLDGASPADLIALDRASVVLLALDEAAYGVYA